MPRADHTMDALYVYDGGTLALAAEAVGGAVGLPLELHDSSYYGGDHYAARRGPDEVIVLENYMEDDGEPHVPTQPVGAICVLVSGFEDARERLAGVARVRRA